MCGITGIFAPGGHGRIDAGALASMSAALALRGPDDHGLHLEKSLGFGFRRLSIMDLSAQANQPFFSEDGSIVLICNGEIYNYRELQRGLLARGHRFRSACDVEVLVHLYEEQGCEFLAGLNGQFALALCDRRQDRLLLARDHVGIAPLFYTETQGQWLFASEIRALLKHPGVEPKVDLTGLDQMLCFPGLVSPHAFRRHPVPEARSLPAGRSRGQPAGWSTGTWFTRPAVSWGLWLRRKIALRSWRRNFARQWRTGSRPMCRWAST